MYSLWGGADRAPRTLSLGTIRTALGQPGISGATGIEALRHERERQRGVDTLRERARESREDQQLLVLQSEISRLKTELASEKAACEALSLESAALKQSLSVAKAEGETARATHAATVDSMNREAARRVEQRERELTGTAQRQAAEHLRQMQAERATHGTRLKEALEKHQAAEQQLR
eukprot:gene4458-8723_t